MRKNKWLKLSAAGLLTGAAYLQFVKAGDNSPPPLPLIGPNGAQTTEQQTIEPPTIKPVNATQLPVPVINPPTITPPTINPPAINAPVVSPSTNITPPPLTLSPTVTDTVKPISVLTPPNMAVIAERKFDVFINDSNDPKTPITNISIAHKGDETVYSVLTSIKDTPIPATMKVWIDRQVPGKKEVQSIAVDWSELKIKGSSKTNHTIMPGDRIYVARALEIKPSEMVMSTVKVPLTSSQPISGVSPVAPLTSSQPISGASPVVLTPSQPISGASPVVLTPSQPISGASLPKSEQKAVIPVAGTVSIKVGNPQGVLDNTGKYEVMISDSKLAYGKLMDYSCHFIKQERIKGQLTGEIIYELHARVKTPAIYAKLVEPKTLAGSELVYVAGKFPTNQVRVKPSGAGYTTVPTDDPRANTGRHSADQIGIGGIIEMLDKALNTERKLNNPVSVTIGDYAYAGKNVVRYEFTAERPHAHRTCFRSVVYIDVDTKLPVRYEAYDEPRSGNAKGDLLESYSFVNLKTNVGHSAGVFDR